MADLPSYKARSASGVDDNPRLTKAINGFKNEWWPPSQSIGSMHEFYGPLTQGDLSAHPVDLASYKAGSFLDDFYNRVYLTPEFFNLGTITETSFVEVRVWNAWEKETTLGSVSVLGDSGIRVSGHTLPKTFKVMELANFDIRVDGMGQYNIDGRVLFNFTDVPDPPYLPITGNRGVVAEGMPEVPVIEYWDYVTNSIKSVTGAEQRMSLLSRANKSVEIRFVSDTPADTRKRAKDFLSRQTVNFVVPYYQYATYLMEDSHIGSYVLKLDATRTDLRDGEPAVLTDSEGLQESVSVDEVSTVANLDGSYDVTLSRPLLRDWSTHSTLSPCVVSFVNTKPVLKHYKFNGVSDTSITFQANEVRTSLSRPGSVASITQYDSLPVLDKIALASQTLDEQYDDNIIEFGDEISIKQRITRWKSPELHFKRDYLIQRHLKPLEMDYWRDFAHQLRGRLRPFLLPTFRADHEVALQPVALSSIVELVGRDYAEVFWPHPTFKRLCLVTSTGVRYVTVTAVSINGADNSVCTLSEAIPADLGIITAVSWLLYCRLDSDRVKLEHRTLDTVISFSIGTISK